MTDQRPPCQGLAGMLFGHAFRPRVEYGQTPVAEFSSKRMHPRELVGILNAGREETYIGERCERCGLWLPADGGE